MLSPRERAVFHFVNSAELRQIANLGRILAERGDPPPTDDELTGLAVRIAEVEKRKFQKIDPSAARGDGPKCLTDPSVPAPCVTG